MSTAGQHEQPTIDIGPAREELDRILSSESFRNADRQRELLVYLFEATTEGRYTDLAGKVIAENVFGIDPTSTRELSTVRVELGRLRRRLLTYYAGDGKTNAGRIDIPKGSYSVTYEQGDMSGRDGSRYVKNPLVIAVSAVSVLVLALGAFGLSAWMEGEPNRIKPRYTESAEAYSLFYETRKIGNPPVIKSRIDAAVQLAQEIQRIDPSFGGGYAAEAMQLWNYVMFGHSDAPESDANRALDLARRAIETDPEFSWSQQALAQALHLNRDIFAAIQAAQRSVDLNSSEADHHGNLGLFLAISGQGAESITEVERALALDSSVRAPYRNMLGIAHFAQRDFSKAAEVIEANREMGGPSGPHMLVFLAASYALAGNRGRADAIADLVRNDTSGFDPKVFIDRLFQVPEQRALLVQGLNAAGLTLD